MKHFAATIEFNAVSDDVAEQIFALMNEAFCNQSEQEVKPHFAYLSNLSNCGQLAETVTMEKFAA
jgi:hypothetical protein